MRFVSYDGEIEFENGIIKIKKGKKDAGRTISLSDVVSVTLKKPGIMMAGVIHIQVMGAKTYSSVANATHYATDVNAICFRKPQYEAAEALKKAIDKAIVDSSSPLNHADELRQFKQLLDDGIITQEEFDKKRAQILGLE